MSDSRDDLYIEDLQNLLDYALKTAYKAKDTDTKAEQILAQSFKLFGKDYKYSIVSNSNGELCSHYPTKLAILEYATTENQKANDRVESLYDLAKMRDLFNKARFARCRARFPVPVILYEGKHICRAATISGGAEIYGRSGFDFFFTGGESIPDGEGNAEPSSGEWQLFNKVRGQDIKLLKTLSVTYICDLMVEKKKVKFGMNVTSSEKVDKEKRYADFCIMSVPYPGCEFFRQWRDNGYMAEGMFFDWNQGYVDAQLEIPSGPLTPPRAAEWSRYKSWDLVKLTQNYLKLLLHYVKEGDSGLLVHCISGWDRTPLFVCLLRLSLWADGAIHSSLSAMEILYLSIAYDWFLFGHNFPDRVAKGEEIFFFCFNFLKYMVSDEFSVRKRTTGRTFSRGDSDCYMDGVLLDSDTHRSSYRGSNTSISSISSINSTKSSVDNAPLYFTTGSQEEDGTLPNGNSNAVGHAASHRVSPVNRLGAEPGKMASVHTCSTYASTSPMAVPTSMKRVTETGHSNSPVCGSWQIISGTGSLRGSASSHESPRSSTSEHSSALSHCGGSHDNSDQPEENHRRQRLDAVRRIFLSAYSNVIGFKDCSADGTGGFSGLLDQFAEKVGIRPARTTVV